MVCSVVWAMSKSRNLFHMIHVDRVVVVNNTHSLQLLPGSAGDCGCCLAIVIGNAEEVLDRWTLS